MDKVKDAFQKVGIDMNFLKNEIGFLSFELNKLKEEIYEINEILQKINEKTSNIPQNSNLGTSTNTLQNSTFQTYLSTHDYPLGSLKPKNLHISTGNQGVSTDRQTDRQTDKYVQNNSEKENFVENSIDNAVKILESLDSIKKDIRLKFKRLTEQEILVFSTLYQIEEEAGFADYKTLAERLNLTESSIRDYIGRLIKKQIPIEKVKINNKQIQLKISNNLKKIASLSTILQLRDI